MKIAVTGSSGLVGSSLSAFLLNLGHEVIPVQRPQHLNIENGTVDERVLEQADAVVHLAGENIASGRWTQARKRRIRESRIKGTRLIAETLSILPRPPRVLVSMSAVGYYGDRGNELLTEDSVPGKGFLADVCREWEAATIPATRKGVRVVQLRAGLVLSRTGGALARMILPFKFGVGGRIGSGKQYWSWISLDDLCTAIVHCVQTDQLYGPINAVSPSPVTNEEFTRVLGRVLSRPTLFPLPAFAARIALGEMADELLLASTRVEPAKLQASNFGFRDRDLEGVLKRYLL